MIDDSFGHWLAGFIDGEGCFYIGAQRRLGAGRPTTYRASFHLGLRDDDADVLAVIAERTGLGRVRRCDWRGESRNGACPKAVWVVSKKAECADLVVLLDRFPLRAKKARDYAVWREAVLLWQVVVPGHRFRGLTDWTFMREAMEALRAGREYAGIEP